MLRSWTLRRRLVVGVALLALVAFLVAGVGTVLALRASLLDRLDEDVRMGVMLAGGPGGGPSQGPGQGPEQRLGTLQLVVDASGTPTTASYVADDGTTSSLTATQIERLLEVTADADPVTVDLGGTLGTMRVAAAEQDGATIVAGQSMDDLDATSGALVGILVAVMGGTLVLLALAIGWLVRRSLQPLERVAATAERVAARPLSEGAVSVPERAAVDEDPRTEVGRVGASLDRLLDHVETSLTARQASEERLRRFVADASHELRTPLASVRGYAQLARAEDAPRTATQERALDRIESEASRMGVLVDDLLLLARLDAGQSLRDEPVDLPLLVVDAVGDAHAVDPSHGWLVDVGDPVQVRGDEARLRQVLANLLANARIHTPAGTTVQTSIAVEGADAVVTVVDDGPGIAPELLPRLFDRFARGDDARTRTEGSTGLGLSISRAIVEAHGGTLTVESAPGRTAFALRLPIAD
ncbi:sensor histidine kinase [Agrococcus jejuensis]|uniref:histidine kinase n=1 Tax=Agrococcus jejuensis TaxID=399736 RepID=A0A1G8DAU3_9MICO|nr:ATP-binding protein [Agrococcus jejuensis]SDH54733.1 two-component system, OmpR family, sensor kinase [Agrococcus jejuensis]